MPDINTLIENCEIQLNAQAHRCDKSRYLAISVAFSDVVSLLPPRGCQHIYWARPDHHYTALGLGQLYYHTANDVDRLQQLQEGYAEHCLLWDQAPMAFTAFAFDAQDAMSDEWLDLPNAFICVPKILIEGRASQQTLTFNIDLHNDFAVQKQIFKHLLADMFEHQPLAQKLSGHIIDEGMSQREWLKIASKAINGIHEQKFRKLVLSRRSTSNINPEFDTEALLTQLIERYSSCTVISCQMGQSQFVSATPERLLSLDNGYLQTDAIGGTLTEEDIVHWGFLLNKQSRQAVKLLEEHGIIVEDICSRLDAVCDTLSLPTSPQLKKLHRIYHLETPIKGKLNQQQSAFSLMSLLHPTPAIAGFPSKAAVAWLSQNEGYSRGWYSGAFGWLRGDQCSEVSVLLRCSLIKDAQIHVYAGAGIVSDSDVKEEWQETKLKMETIQDLI